MIWSGSSSVGEPACVEHGSQVIEIVSFAATLDCDVVNIAFHRFPYMIKKNCAHGALISCTHTFQSERHYCVTVYPQWCSEWCMILIIWVHLNFIVPCKAIHEGHTFKATCIVNYDISDGQRKFIFRTGCIEIMKVDADSDLSFFKHRDNISNTASVLHLSNKAAFDEFMNFDFDCLHDVRSKPSLLLLN